MPAGHEKWEASELKLILGQLLDHGHPWGPGPGRAGDKSEGNIMHGMGVTICSCWVGDVLRL